MNEIIITLATVPAILALVTLAKGLGLPSRVAPLLAIFLGVALTMFDAIASGLMLDLQGMITAIGSGVILGLSASGLYDGANLIGKRRSTTSQGAHAADATTDNEDLNTLFKL